MSKRRPTGGWQLGQLAGVPVVVAWSWFVVAGLLGYWFYTALAAGGQVGTTAALLQALALVLVLFISVLIHELAHGLTGRAARMAPKQYVLTFFGGHTTFTSPYPGPGAAAAVSFAGPAANFVLAGLCWLIGHFGAPPGFSLPWLFGSSAGLPANAALWLGLVYYAAMANCLVGMFNLIPAAPLDGGGLIEALVWKLTGRRTSGLVAAGWCGLVAAVGLLVWALWQQSNNRGFDSVIWWVLIAVVVGQGAVVALRQGRSQARLANFSVAKTSQPAFELPDRTNLDQALVAIQRHRAGSWVAVVNSAGQVTGLVAPGTCQQVPAAEASGLSLDAVMQVVPPNLAIAAEASGVEALRVLFPWTNQASHLPVVQAGQVVGVLDLEEVRRIIGQPKAR